MLPVDQYDPRQIGYMSCWLTASPSPVALATCLHLHGSADLSRSQPRAVRGLVHDAGAGFASVEVA